VAGYVRPLAREPGGVETRPRERALVRGLRRHPGDRRLPPRHARGLTILRGLDRRCTRRAIRSRTSASLAAASSARGSNGSPNRRSSIRLAPLLERGLVLANGLRYLGLAVAGVIRVPSTTPPARLLKRARTLGRREGSANRHSRPDVSRTGSDERSSGP
jgi:hypothetical protein